MGQRFYTDPQFRVNQGAPIKCPAERIGGGEQVRGVRQDAHSVGAWLRFDGWNQCLGRL